jgi:uncharacterized coiled-coil protein SlyX
MRNFSHNGNRRSGARFFREWVPLSMVLALIVSVTLSSQAQNVEQQNLPERIQRLSDAMASTQAQLEHSQRQLEEMRKELAELRRQMAAAGAGGAPATNKPPDSSLSEGTGEALAAAVRDIQEHQAIEESQIATHEQTKVESNSKYPVRITGLLLMNGFVNTGAVDMPATPTVALPGYGNAGASVRQTVLGFDARGPRLFGARSFADLRIDFASSPSFNDSTTNYSGYLGLNSTFLRLRTAHAGLDWDHTEVFFSLDHPIFSAESPTSLVATAEPALAWSGNLWTWNPQAGITENIGRMGARNLQLQVALIDAGDAPLTPSDITPMSVPLTSAEQASRPGVQARIALLGRGRKDERSHIGVGGYFAVHNTALDLNFDSWAATLDGRLLLFGGLELSGSFYRGLGLGGLGGGAYKDFVYKPNPNTGGYYFRALDDVGGWAQLKKKLGERLEFNSAYGMDNAFSSQMRHYIVTGGTMYQNLTINRTFTGNVIYSPSAYLLFSLEYRHIQSSPIAGSPAQSNVVGVGAGYKF